MSVEHAPRWLSVRQLQTLFGTTAAFVAGATHLAIPLSHTSKLHREDDTVVMLRSPAFLAIR